MPQSLADLVKRAQRGGLTDKQVALKERWRRTGRLAIERIGKEFENTSLLDPRVLRRILRKMLDECGWQEATLRSSNAWPIDVDDPYLLDFPTWGKGVRYIIYVEIEKSKILVTYCKLEH